MAYWLEDGVSEAPRVVFTPPVNGANYTHAGLRRLVYDPTAAPDKRWTAELSHMYAPNETLDDVRASLGGDFSWNLPTEE